MKSKPKPAYILYSESGARRGVVMTWDDEIPYPIHTPLKIDSRALKMIEENRELKEMNQFLRKEIKETRKRLQDALAK